MKNIELAPLRRSLGERAFNAALILARKQQSATRKQLMEIAREFVRKGKTIKETAERMEQVYQLARDARSKRQVLRNRYSPLRPHFSLALPRLHIAPLSERLSQYKARLAENRIRPLKSALDRALGYVSHSAPTIINQNAVALSDVKVTVNHCHDGFYGGRTKWPLIRHQIICNVRADWPEMVGNKGLAEIHGLVTLALQPVENEREGEEIWRAIWARKTQGANLVTESGYIIRRGAELAHGQTIPGTRAVLTRRETEKQLDRLENEILRRLESGQFNGAENLQVTVRDSLNAGNCEPGTLAFRDKHFPGRESASVREVITCANSFGDRRFAIAACVKALRRQHYVPTVA